MDSFIRNGLLGGGRTVLRGLPKPIP
jgi:hypothetical protein